MATGCTTFNNFKNAFFSNNGSSDSSSESTIRIGVYEPLSGAFKAEGNEEKIGIELANELYPEVLGKKVELIYADNQGSMDVAETVINELVAQNPLVILGSYGDTVTLVAGDAIKANDIPSITITATNPLITVNNPYYFMATFPADRQGDALAEYICQQQSVTKAATVKIALDDTTTATIKRFNDKVKALTGDASSIVANIEVQANATDYSDAIKSIKDSGAQAVYLALSPTVATEFLKQAEDANLTDVLYLGTNSWNDEKFLKFVKADDIFKVAYTTDFSADVADTEISKEFMEAYHAKYGKDAQPTEATAIAFDAYLMALKAIENAYEDTISKTEADVESMYTRDAAKQTAVQDWQDAKESGIPSGKAIKEALSNLKDFVGASGSLSYDGGNEASKSVVINYIDKGKVQENFIVE
jgi:branched-chain amino acid transport system substrate-binding protein